MAHLNIVTDSYVTNDEIEDSEVLNYEYFCSDFCARQSANYAGWYGCVELEHTENCYTCNTPLYFVRYYL